MQQIIFCQHFSQYQIHLQCVSVTKFNETVALLNFMILEKMATIGQRYCERQRKSRWERDCIYLLPNFTPALVKINENLH